MARRGRVRSRSQRTIRRDAQFSLLNRCSAAVAVFAPQSQRSRSGLDESAKAREPIGDFAVKRQPCVGDLNGAGARAGVAAQTDAAMG